MYRVSVIIPVYNVEQYLRECLDSAVNQTLKEIEVICIDDGSSDNSARIVAEYMEKHPNIKLIRQENSGPSIARNAGLDIATGEYICFLDSDDRLAPHALEKLYSTASQKQLDILHFDAATEFEGKEVERTHAHMANSYSRSIDYSGVCTGQTMFARMRQNADFQVVVWGQLFRRAFLDEQNIRFYPGILHEDNLFSFQSTMTAQRVDYIPDTLYFRRLHTGSIMTSPKTMLHVDGHLVCFRECVNFLKDITVQEDAALHVDTFLYNRLLQEAAIVWQQLPEEEQKKPPCNGDRGAKQLLDTALRICKLENRAGALTKQKQALTERNQQLAGQLQAVRRKLRKLEEEKSRWPGQRIKHFFRKVKRHGLLFAIRDAVWKLRKAFARFMSARTRGATQAFYTLAAEKGYRYARQETARQRRDERLRQQRIAEAKRLIKEGSAQPLVSFIVPVYNAQPYLQQAMDSLINQTLKHIEIICVDDGSTDSSPEILRRYAQEDPRVRVFTQRNQYAGVARNLGLSKASGEYVCFLDADDFFEKSLAEDAYFAAKSVEADIAIFGAAYYDNITGQIQTRDWLFNRWNMPEKRPFNRNDCPDNLFQLTIPSPWTKMFRRRFLLDTGLQFQALRNANDIYFACISLAMAERIATLDKILVYYRTNVSTSLQATKAKDPLCFYEALKAVHRKLKELGLLEQLRRSYINSALNECIGYWRRQSDPAAKQAVEEVLRAEAFRELELIGYEKSCYRSDEHYKAMQAILSAGKAEE